MQPVYSRDKSRRSPVPIGMKEYKCDECSVGPFRKKKDVWAHKKIVHGDRRHQCSHCPKAFPTLSKLLRHNASHNRKCTHCEEVFFTFHAWRQHIFQKHPKKYPCPWCERVYDHFINVERHKLICHNRPKEGTASSTSNEAVIVKQVPTEVSEPEVSDEEHDEPPWNVDLDEMMEVAHPQLPVSYPNTESTCSTLRSISSPVSSLMSPIPSTSSSSLSSRALESDFRYCPQCGAGPYLKKSQLYGHSMRVHGERRFVCSSCEKAFPCLSKLTRHETTHHQRECEVCGAKCPSFAAYRLHKAVEHPTIFTCTKCSRPFTTKNTLSQHEAECRQTDTSSCLVRLPLPTVACIQEGCGKVFTRRSNMMVHCRLHHPEMVQNVEDKSGSGNMEVSSQPSGEDSCVS